MTTTANMAGMTDARALEISRQIAGDDATVSIHHGDRNHRAVRITGCTQDEGRRLAGRIAQALYPHLDPREESPRLRPSAFVASQAGFVCVWIS